MSESANVNQTYENAAAKTRETVEKTMKAGQAATEKAAKTGKETAEKAYMAGSQAMTNAYEQAAVATKEAIGKAFPQAAVPFDAVAGFQRANLEAMVAAGAVAMKGVEAMSQQVLAFNSKAMEDGMANAEKLLACKSVPEALEAQTQCAMAQMHDMLAHGGKLADLALKLAGDIAEPVQARFSQAAEKLGKPPAL